MSAVRFDHFRALALDENAPAMAAMLDAGFDVNTVNAAHQTVLMHCCANGRSKAARLLVARGADVNVVDHGGTTAMDFAVRHASRDLCDWLARSGARIGASGDYAHRPTGEHRA
jgi:ankyrin repeat protein